MRYTIIYFILLLFAIFSCKEKTKEVLRIHEQENPTIVLEHTPLITIPLDSATVPRYLYFHDNQIYLLNKFTKAIQIYDFNSGELVKRIPLEKEGPNGVGNPTSLFITSSDSIFVFATAQFRLSLIGSNANVLSDYRLLSAQELNEDGKYRNVKSIYTGSVNDHFARNPIAILKKDKLHVSSHPFDNSRVNPENYYKNSFANMIIDLQSKELNYSISFPKSYHGKILTEQFVIMFYRTFHPKRQTFIYSFAIDENLYEYTLDGELVGTYLATSNKFKGVAEIKRKGEYNPREDFEHYKRYPHFSEVVYNPYRDEYYRFIFYLTDKVNYESSSARFSVIVLDNNFNIKGEAEMPKEYSPKLIIPNEKGFIYFYNDKTNENLVLYQLEF